VPIALGQSLMLRQMLKIFLLSGWQLAAWILMKMHCALVP